MALMWHQVRYWPELKVANARESIGRIIRPGEPVDLHPRRPDEGLSVALHGARSSRRESALIPGRWRMAPHPPARPSRRLDTDSALVTAKARRWDGSTMASES
jgi:hypothetical protein